MQNTQTLLWETVRDTLRNVIFKAGYTLMYPTVPKRPGTQEVIVEKHKRKLTFVIGRTTENFKAAGGVSLPPQGGVPFVMFSRHKKKQLKEEDTWFGFPEESVTEEAIKAWVMLKLASLAKEEPVSANTHDTAWLRHRAASRPHIGGGPHSGGKKKKGRQRYHNSAPYRIQPEKVPGAPQSLVIDDE